jgi:hypothetical protein
MDTLIPLREQRDNDLVRLLLKHKYYLVALRGGSSNHAFLFRRLADSLPALLCQRMQSKTTQKRQVQRRLTPERAGRLAQSVHGGRA